MTLADSEETLLSRIAIDAAACSRASPEQVFALLKDGSTWPLWAGFDRFELERPGEGEPFGVGAIRVFSTKVTCAREQVVELIPARRLSYVLLSGFPFRDYRADVDLEPVDGGTVIHWRSRFEISQIGLGWFWRLFMTLVLNTTSQRLAAAAERGPAALI
ncbi:MAG TPA: SRPBCC family protein [Caulobacteraceae bacterium]|nr:SRPBCC family protein [Caulobacteraceae bacterium]